MTQLLWLRNDLRISDNTALHAAASNGPVIALWLSSPAQWQLHDDAPCKVDFWLRNLKVLRAELAGLGIPLLIREAPLWQDAPAIIAGLCREHAITCVQVNEEYGIHESRRDDAVRTALAAQGVGFVSHLDSLLFAPGSLLTRSGGYFKVFSQFRKSAWARLAEDIPARLPVPPAQAPLPIASDQIPQQIAGFDSPEDGLRSLWPAGEAAAQTRLHAFADEQLLRYEQQRDFPAIDGTSALSPYLAAGVISIRQCLHAALAANRGEFASGNAGVQTWISELLWREFYRHVLVGFPRVCRQRAFKPETEALPWRDAPDDLAAWQQGRTGLPIVDAAMRQLLATGWMHNRLRMISAMFLTKNLLIDWRHGERWFMQHLIDGDLAANNGGWQWSASTGTDAVPYFRIFNPLSQSEKFDPDGEFLRQWLPELRQLRGRELHNPAAAGGLFAPAGYPAPIVDLPASRERALAAFKAL